MQNDKHAVASERTSTPPRKLTMPFADKTVARSSPKHVSSQDTTKVSAAIGTNEPEERQRKSRRDSEQMSSPPARKDINVTRANVSPKSPKTGNNNTLFRVPSPSRVQQNTRDNAKTSSMSPVSYGNDQSSRLVSILTTIDTVFLSWNRCRKDEGERVMVRVVTQSPLKYLDLQANSVRITKAPFENLCK